MNIITPNYQNFIGIDISKKDFVSAIHGNCNTETYMNNKEGWQQFITKHCHVLNMLWKLQAAMR